MLVGNDPIIIFVYQFVELEELRQEFFVLGKLEAKDGLDKVIEQDLWILGDLSHLHGGCAASGSFLPDASLAVRGAQIFRAVEAG